MNNSIKQKIIVSFTSGGVPPVVRAMQFDNNMRIVEVEMTANGVPYPVPDGYGVNIRMRKPDGTCVYNPALEVTGHKAKIVLTQQMLAISGKAVAILEVVGGADGTDILGTARWCIDIAPNPVPEEYVESTDEFKTVQQLAADCEAAAQAAAASAQNAAASASAAGTRAEEANASAQDAASSASAAKKAAQEAGEEASQVINAHVEEKLTEMRVIDESVQENRTAAQTAAAAAEQSAGQVASSVSDLQKDVSESRRAIAELNDKKITKFYASNLGETNLHDSDNGKIQDMVLYGKGFQQQYSGKNLCKINDVTVDGGGNPSYPIIIDVVGISELTLSMNIKRLENVNISNTTIYAFSSRCKDENENVLSSINPLVTINDYNVHKYSYTLSVPDGATKFELDFINRNGDTNTNTRKYDIQVEIGSQATDYEPYVGGIPSPNPDYPQEIKSVVNPVVTISDKDGTKTCSATLPYTLNAIPVDSGGNVTIDGQQYIADYVDFERGELHRLVDEDKLDASISIVNNTDLLLSQEEIIDLTDSEVAAFKELATYYPATNISVTSDQLDGYTMFNYPISLAEGWNYVKEQLGDTREYIYDMDLQSAEAFVNSEYAVALAELEV